MSRHLHQLAGEGLLTTVSHPDVARTYSAFLQIGMHGAGLVNAFFMKPGAALIEIFPCRFGDEHQRNYFWHPSHAEMQTFAFQIFVTDEAACKPSELQKHPEGEEEQASIVL